MISINVLKLTTSAFLGIGIALAAFAVWALYITTIPFEQFANDPRFQEEYALYYQALIIFASALVAIGVILTMLIRKMKIRL